MGSPQTDVAMWSATPGAVPAPAFKTTKRGYDQAEVTDYIRQMTERLQTVESQVRQLRSEAEQARQQRDEAIRERDSALQGPTSDGAYEQVSSRVAELMMDVDRDVQKIREEAEAEADHLLTNARSEAARLESEAEERRTAADQAARLAHEEAERSLADLTSQRDVMLEELRLTGARLLEVIATLEQPARGEN
ncbi:MAG: DivIVA domain-containing protein [Actinomycetota bacterium]